RLRRRGVKPGDVVGLRVEQSAKLIIGLLSILKVGGAYLPIERMCPQTRVSFILADSGVRVVICDEAAKFPGVETVLLDTTIDTESAENLPAPEVNDPAGRMAYAMYTSGSTGQPKAVCVPHRAVVRLVRDTNYVQFFPADRVAQASNPAFDALTFEVWGALLNGACLIGISRDVLLSPRDLANFIDREKISVMFLTVALFNQVAAQIPSAFRGLRHMMFGGEAADAAAVRRVLRHGPPERLVNGYGPTECTTFATWFLVDSLPDDALLVPIGWPISNTRIHVLDRALRPVPVGVPGELCLGGDGLAIGYLNQPDLTAERFVTYTGDPDGRIYRTGDRVRYRTDGCLEFLGRFDDQLKLRGFRIEPGEIEAVLSAHPAVRESVVFARDDPAGSRCLVACVVPRAGAALEMSAVRSFIAERLPAYMVPTAFIPLATLPLSPNGKLDRTALAALPCPQLAPESESGEVATLTEELLTANWRRLFGRGRIGVQENFFDLGGHSLLAVEMLARLETEVGKRIPLATLFAHPTIRGLAAVISQDGDAERPSVIVLQTNGDKPPFFFFYGDVIPGADFCTALAKHLQEDQPLYVIPPPHVDRYPAYPSLEETARALIATMRSVRPTGPYVLGGYCFAGFIAYEVARQLVALHEKVPVVVLIDTISPERIFLRRSRKFIERAGSRLGVEHRWQIRIFTILWNFLLRYRGWQRLSLGRKLTLFPSRFVRWLEDFPRHLRLDHARTNGGTISPPVRDTVLGFVWEISNYRVPAYQGRVVLFLSQEEASRRDDPSHGWAKLAARIEVERTPGDHGGCVTTHRDVVIEKIRATLAPPRSPHPNEPRKPD
ncbi:MAG: amino acid adenylation domain-containing protein, partial [Chthoniobacteraceae bacterium]